MKRRENKKKPVNAVDWNFAIVGVAVAFVVGVESLNVAAEFDSVDSRDAECPSEFRLNCYSSCKKKRNRIFI